MLFVTLGKFKRKPTKEGVAQFDKLWKEVEKDGVKRVALYWTLGQYDTVVVLEAPDERALMKGLLKFSDAVASETLVAVKREDAIKLVE
jgi:uncharacterized protein with GYD domain